MTSAATLEEPAANPRSRRRSCATAISSISHVANILMYLGPRLGLAPGEEALRHFAHGLQLTITDFVCEVHDTHHPISNGALLRGTERGRQSERSAGFLDQRMPKFLGYFERILERNPDGRAQAVGDATSYVDLSLFQIVEGLRYAFPRASSNFAKSYPLLTALARGVRARPNVAAYLKSDRRLEFNESGIFRRYPELDQDAK